MDTLHGAIRKQTNVCLNDFLPSKSKTEFALGLAELLPIIQHVEIIESYIIVATTRLQTCRVVGRCAASSHTKSV